MNDQEKHQARDGAAAEVYILTRPAFNALEKLIEVPKDGLPEHLADALHAWMRAGWWLRVEVARSRQPAMEAAYQAGQRSAIAGPDDPPPDCDGMADDELAAYSAGIDAATAVADRQKGGKR